MKLRLFATTILAFTTLGSVRAAAPVELELAAQSGVQITAQHAWLQLLTSAGIENVRIRPAKTGDRPSLENLGTSERPRYRVGGILTTRDDLLLPGSTFTRGERSRLKEYLEQLSADGGESLTAPRGLFGLTENEFDTVFADLSQPTNFSTAGQSPGAIIKRFQDIFKARVVADAESTRALASAKTFGDELQGISAGTSLAIVLRSSNLVLRPEKPRGEAAIYRIATLGADVASQNTLGKTADAAMTRWPIGWESQTSPGRLAPSLFEYLNAEIDGYSLEETLAAIGPRLKIPMFLDHTVLAAYDINPAQVQVRMPRGRVFYKRLIDRVLAQARLRSELRVDEVGNAFLWITR